jgi:hypothetical protein
MSVALNCRKVVRIDEHLNFAQYAETQKPMQRKPSRIDWPVFLSGALILGGVLLVATIFWLQASAK